MDTAGRATGLVVKSGPIVIDTDRREVKTDGHKVHLTPSEYRILLKLVEADGQVLSREKLVPAGDEATPRESARQVDVHVSAIRRKIPASHKWIRTVYGIGYAWTEPADMR